MGQGTGDEGKREREGTGEKNGSTSSSLGSLQSAKRARNPPGPQERKQRERKTERTLDRDENRKASQAEPFLETSFTLAGHAAGRGAQNPQSPFTGCIMMGPWLSLESTAVAASTTLFRLSRNARIKAIQGAKRRAREPISARGTALQSHRATVQGQCRGATGPAKPESGNSECRPRV
ncbi:hypothetical protein BDW62DRAFT_170047 [Aspergillus aurantiobrunneus]